jgi:hypothetical protein
MRFSTIAALVLTSIFGASALPAMTQRQAMDIDPDILQFALTVSEATYLRFSPTYTFTA